jgi:hypothetical protein
MESIKRAIKRLQARKTSIKSVRVDWPTMAVIEEVAQQLELSDSEVIRGSVWIVSILLDKSVTLRQVLRQEAIEKLVKGEDVAVIDALRLENLIVEKFKSYVGHS